VDRVACFSNADSSLDMLAPGDAIFSSSAPGGVAAGVGTSFASPHVAAAAALLLAIEPSLTPARVEELLESTGRPLIDHRTGETFKRLDVFAAIRALRPEPPPSGPKRRAARR
jgi:serine protease